MLGLKHFVLFCLLLFSAQSLYAVACVTISQNMDWKNIEMEKGVPAYLSTRVYNSSAAGYYCDPADYEVELKLETQGIGLEGVFEWEIKPASFHLDDGENKPVLLTLVPKVASGRFNFIITAKRLNPGAGGTQIFHTASAVLTAVVGSEVDPQYSEVPFWTVRKDCPGGFVVKVGEECPRASCADGTLVYGDELCPEEKGRVQENPLASGNGLGKGVEELVQEAGFPLELVVAIAAVIVACSVAVFSFLYIRMLKKELGKRHGG